MKLKVLKWTSITFWGLRSRWTMCESWMKIRAFTISTTNLIRKTKRRKIQQLTFCTSPPWDHTLKSPLLKRVLLPARIPLIKKSMYITIPADTPRPRDYVPSSRNSRTWSPPVSPPSARRESRPHVAPTEREPTIQNIYTGFFLTDPSSYKRVSGWLLDFFILLSKKGDPATLNKNTL